MLESNLPRPNRENEDYLSFFEDMKVYYEATSFFESDHFRYDMMTCRSNDHAIT